MSDDLFDRPNSTDARLAVLESQMRAISARLEAVSARTHEQGNSLGVVLVNTEEAREQRNEMMEKIDDVAQRVGNLTTSAAVAASDIAHHVRICEQRGARIQALCIALLAALFPLIGFLVYSYLQTLR